MRGRGGVIAVLLGAVVGAGCGPSPDGDAVSICQEVPAAFAQLDDVYGRIPQTNDFDRIMPLLMEVLDAIEFLSDWTAVATDDLNGPVREAARSALAGTGTLHTGGNPVNSRELEDDLRSAASLQWPRLWEACNDGVTSLTCLSAANLPPPSNPTEARC